MNQLTTQWISEKSSIRRFIYIHTYIIHNQIIIVDKI